MPATETSTSTSTGTDTGTIAGTSVVIVVVSDGRRTDWLHLAQVLAWHGRPAAVPYPVFPVRRRRLTGWVTRWTTRGLLDPVRRRGAVVRAAGGRRSRLDLPALATRASQAASARWWTWHAHVAHGTAPATPWEHFLAEHHRDPDRLPLPEARRRFEAQPRVLAMLAYNSYPAAPMRLDVEELAAFQAGEAVYVALAWQHALTGDALITPDGQFLQPASASLADRLRYHAAAGHVLADQPDTAHLAAVKAAPAP